MTQSDYAVRVTNIIDAATNYSYLFPENFESEVGVCFQKRMTPIMAAAKIIEADPIVTIRFKHRAGAPNTAWVDPVGWEPDISKFGDDAIFDGAVWTNEDDEVAGLAIDWGAVPPKEGMEYDMQLSNLFWLFSRSLVGGGAVQIKEPS